MLPVIVDKHSMLPPATCFKCRGDQGSPRLYWMHMGVTLDFEGVVYYCNECLYDIVKAMPDSFVQSHIDKLILAYDEEIEEYKIRDETATAVLARLRHLGFDTDKLLDEGDYGRDDGDDSSAEPVSDERPRGKQFLFDGDEPAVDESVVSGKFRIGQLGDK